MIDDKVKPFKSVRELLELHLVMDYMAIVDQSQNLGSDGYSVSFGMGVLNPIGDKIEASIKDPELKKIMSRLLGHRYDKHDS